MDSPILNRAVLERHEHISLGIEEVAHDIKLESSTKVVEESITLEGPYKPEDMMVEDYVMPTPSDLGFVALKRVATTPVTLKEVRWKVPKIETEIGGPNVLCRW